MRILIANRGEIARRIIRTARALGHETVAVYGEPDRDAAHVREADVAFRLGPPALAESYLSQERLLDAIRDTGAEAVHPGYGFLAENPAFASAVVDSNLVFIGPPADAIERMGDRCQNIAEYVIYLVIGKNVGHVSLDDVMADVESGQY